MRIAHITDIHIARPPALNEYNAKRLLGYVNYRLFRSKLYKEVIANQALAGIMDNPPDLFLLTGDITQHGLDTEFAAAEELLAPATARNIPVIAVPGNHDIYGYGTVPALEVFLRKIAHPLIPDDKGIFHLPGVEILPLFQGIPTPPFLSYGRQNPEELIRAGEVWKEEPKGVMRLVIGHYPVIDPHGGGLLSLRGLKDADRLIEFCARHKVAGYFCGHNHKRQTAAMPGGCVQFAGPALSSVRGANKEWISIYECGPQLKTPLEVGGSTQS